MHHFRFEVLLFIALMITWVHGQECGNVTLTANSGVFTSPNYPKEYDHKLNCNWTIMAPKGYFIQLSLKDFDLKNPFFDCSHDYIVVTTGPETSEKYCNDKRPNDTVLSRSNSMKVNLRTDNFFRNGLGFKAVYQVVDEDGNPINDEKEGETELKTVKPTTTMETTSSTSTTTTKSSTVSVLVTKITNGVSSQPGDDSPRLASNPGKMSGLVISGIVAAVAIAVLIICIIAFIRYKRNANKRINLSHIVTPDNKELINDGKVYKKLNNKIVRDPESDPFEL